MGEIGKAGRVIRVVDGDERSAIYWSMSVSERGLAVFSPVC